MASNTVKTKFWHPEGDRVVCDLCPRQCAVQNGQRGLCFVRMADQGEIVLTTYGRSSGFCVDPIEKKPLNHFLPGSSILSFGTAGCNLTCQFCQNWDISKAREVEKLNSEADPETIAKRAAEIGCKSVAFTYNDPIIWMEYAIDVARACHSIGIKTVAVTAGYINEEPRTEFFKYMDAANIDLKGFTDEFYRRICSGRLEPILDTLKYVRHHTSTWLEITTLLIPGANDSDEELSELTSWIARELGPEVPLHFTAFHPDFRMMDRPRTPPETLTRARKIALQNGLRFVYTGNVHDEFGGSTYCPQCLAKLIGRNWYDITSWHLDSTGRCLSCKTQIPGVIDGPPGSWGSRRLPIAI